MNALRSMPSPAGIVALPGRLLAAVTHAAPTAAATATTTTTTAAPLPRPRIPLMPSSFSATGSSRTFSSTAAAAAPPPPRRKGPPQGQRGFGGPPGSMSRSRRMRAERDPKIKMLDKALYRLRFVPPPLRMGRNRYLRHWTIHRAWLLFRRQGRETRERELMQQFQSMSNACEELRTSCGPGLRDEGYLYRVAMEKKGVYRHGGVPIEYARPQTETPAYVPWNHDWKR